MSWSKLVKLSFGGGVFSLGGDDEIMLEMPKADMSLSARVSLCEEVGVTIPCVVLSDLSSIKEEFEADCCPWSLFASCNQCEYE